MKELELYRMNFVNRRGKGFTYRKMLVVFAGWIVFLVALYGFQIARQVFMSHKISSTKKATELLNTQKNRQIELIQVLSQQRAGTIIKQDLAQTLELRPMWSRVVQAFVKSLPPKVWLDSLLVKPTDKGYMFTVIGKATSQREITNLILQIELGGLFNRTALVKSNQVVGSEGFLEYEINTYPIMNKF